MKLKKKKTICSILAIMMMVSLNIGSVFAADNSSENKGTDEFLKIGTVFYGMEGHMEQVIRIASDGSYVTEVLDQKDIENYRISCDHPAASLVAVGNLANDTKMVATASCCFKHRSVTRCQCKKCGAAVKTYGAWKYHKNHSFPLLGKTCKTCGYKK